MKNDWFDYDVYPKVFLVGKPVEITVKPLGAHVTFKGDYTVRIMSMDHGNPREFPNLKNLAIHEASVDTDGCIRITHEFQTESEYVVRIMKEEEQVANLYVYALDEDMQGRYYPALEAIDAYKDVPHEMNIVFGEEVHLPDNGIHIVNFGGKYSINGLWDESEQNKESDRRAVIDNPPPMLTKEQYEAEVNALSAELNIPEEIDQFTYASCVWIFNHIRKGEGLGIFCHPYWVRRNREPYQVPESFCRYMTMTRPFDAFEVLGGARYFQQNGLQTIRYYEDRAQGIHYPIVGSTDSHNSIPMQNANALIGSTFVFARENERESLISAIKEEYTVAVDTISTEYRLVGEIRFVKYVRFLLDEFTPLHDDLCFEEGRLMKAYATGDEEAAEDLKYIYGRMKKLYDKYFRL